MLRLSAVCPLILLLAGVDAAGIGEAWQITPYLKSLYPDHLFWPRFDSTAFEVRTVSGVGRLPPLEESRNARKHSELTTSSSVEQNSLPDVEKTSHLENENIERFQKLLENSSRNDDEVEAEEEDPEDAAPIRKMFRKTLMMRLLHANDNDESSANEAREIVRVRRQAENETSMEKISTTKSVREARLNSNSPETWSSSVQPISVEFRHRIPLDQVIRQQQEEEEAAALSNSYRRHQAPRVDFVTGQHHRRNYPEYRESRDMPITRNYDDYDQMSWYRNAIREREYPYEYSYRRGYSYHNPDRYRMERDYYARLPNEPNYYYDRYRDDSDFDLYGRNRATPKPRRIIYYATLPEVVRKPVDLRNYPRYDKASVTRDGAYKRVPGNVDPVRYRYRQYGYDPYAKRSSYYDRTYEYPESDSRKVRVSTKENLSSERKVSNLIAIRDNDGKLPWPVQIGTEVSIKDDERIPGRKIFGESHVGYDRFQSAQLQKAPDATGSSELQSDN
ncbi:uncharacterized protein LOC114943064 [Nylanderia fulva]|uniref:uncharacterized protein LOC114943064 n=1 Tax=Nylanderia fulva TaxID=613905 RepID=UPI0010FB745A|nr:uncharacterized protein LOC114943064 [Nylanderia fulva]